ncbi:hypothetical protein RB595_007121 [Gaeumannomyces hyphopodioides]
MGDSLYLFSFVPAKTATARSGIVSVNISFFLFKHIYLFINIFTTPSVPTSFLKMLASVSITLVTLLASLAAAMPAPAPVPAALLLRARPLAGNATRNGTACADGKTNGPVVKHKIVQGDTLTKLAATFQSGICNIAKESKLANVDLLQLGQEVSIPTKLCRQNVDDKSCLPKPGTRVCLPDGPATRVIKAGDSFVGLSQQLNLTEAAVLGANPGVDRFNLQPGQVVNLPVCKK